MAMPFVQACSCFGNSSYCETLSPTWFDTPDATALVVKLGDFHYGIHVKVVHVFGDGTTNDDTITVWGDQGILCRHYLNGIPVGDSLVMGLDITDLTGNMFRNPEYPPDLEHPEDYMLSFCGVHVLNFVGGQVHGRITGPEISAMSLTAFDDLVRACAVAAGVGGAMEPEPLSVAYHDGVPVVRFLDHTRTLTLRLLDAQGRTVLHRGWTGSPYALQAPAAGIYMVEVRSTAGCWVRRVLVP